MRMLFCSQGGREFFVPERVLRRDHLVHDPLDGVEGVRRAHAVRPDIARLARDLLLDARDANLEKLVEIRAHDPEEFYPLEQRLRRVLRFLEDAAVELQPAQLAVDEIRVIREVRAAGRSVDWDHRHDVIRRRGSRRCGAGWHETKRAARGRQ